MAYDPTAWNEEAPPGISSAALNKIEKGIKDAHEALSGIDTSGSSNLLVVSGSVTLDDGLPVGSLVGYRATAPATFTGQGGSVVLSAGAYIFERVTGGWEYRTLAEGTGLTPPVPDTTPPTAGTLGVTTTETAATLTVTGAMDDVALHAEPYSFSTNAGSTWTSYQSSNVYDATTLTPGTSYAFRHRVRDAAGNVTTGATVTASTIAALVWTTLSESDFEVPDQPLDGFVPAVGSALMVTDVSGGAATVQQIKDGQAYSPVESGNQPSLQINWSAITLFSGIRATFGYDLTPSTSGWCGLKLARNSAFSNDFTLGVNANQTIRGELYGSGTLTPTVAPGAPAIPKSGTCMVEAIGTPNGDNWTFKVSIGGVLHTTYTFSGGTLWSTQARLALTPSAAVAAVVSITDYKIETAP